MTAAELVLCQSDPDNELRMYMNETRRRFAGVVVDSQSLYAVVRSKQLDSIFGIWLDYLYIALPAISRLLADEPPDGPADRIALYVCHECGDLGCGAATVTIKRSDVKLERSASSSKQLRVRHDAPSALCRCDVSPPALRLRTARPACPDGPRTEVAGVLH